LLYQKTELLAAASFTSNGKTATPEQQSKVLAIVRSLETEKPASTKILSDPNESQKLDGVWYLQYTSPSQVGDDDKFPDSWKPARGSPNEPAFKTPSFKAEGSVNAAGIKVDTSNRVVRQIFDIKNSRVCNLISLDDKGNSIKVEGTFRKSSTVPIRAVVGFDSVEIKLLGGNITLNLGFLFSILAAMKGTSDNGWLETTYIDDSLRIGRGNKGTLFILTRDAEAVKP
jgi:hypothetical protein